ncbi:MAG: hypothetical protein L7G92_00375 [Stygiolobus sp.]|jgi:hypothetical protein|nr:hypothetical protein [Stygiolobus sp.]
MDDDFLNYLLSSDNGKYKRSNEDIILRKLNEIESILMKISRRIDTNGGGNKSKIEVLYQIIDKGYVILSTLDLNPSSHPSLFIIELDGKFLVTFKDTIELLQCLAEKYKDQIEEKIPKRLLPLFLFLKRNGLVYYDHESKTYKLVK